MPALTLRELASWYGQGGRDSFPVCMSPTSLRPQYPRSTTNQTMAKDSLPQFNPLAAQKECVVKRRGRKAVHFALIFGLLLAAYVYYLPRQVRVLMAPVRGLN